MSKALPPPPPKTSPPSELTPEPEPDSAQVVPDPEFLYRDDFVTIWLDGSANFHFRNAPEAKLAAKGLRLLKKQLRVQLKEINTNLREVRHQYTDYTRRRGSMVRGGGNLGKLVRFVQTVSRDANRHQLAQNIQPLHTQKEYLERLINSVDQHLIRIESLLLQY